MKSKVAIVILNWNGRKYLEQFLPYVVADITPQIKVIVADNASTDDSVSFVQSHFPEVGIIQLTENYGFAKGYNKALQQVDAEYYVLLNSDVEVAKGWVEPIIQLMDADHTIGACQPKLLTYHQKNTFEYAGGAGGWLDGFGYPFARGRVFDYCEEDNGQYNTNAAIFWASGAAMFVRSEVYHALKGLDEYFFAHQEEIDFCWRLQLAGYKVMACPASVVYHVGGGTLPKGNRRKVYLNFRNNLIMLAKNLPLSKAVCTIGLRFILDGISAWKSLFAGQSVYFWAIGKAHMGFFKWLLLHRSKSVFPIQKINAVTGMYKGNIAWKYFILGKKRFSEIVDTNE